MRYECENGCQVPRTMLLKRGKWAIPARITADCHTNAATKDPHAKLTERTRRTAAQHDTDVGNMCGEERRSRENTGQMPSRPRKMDAARFQRRQNRLQTQTTLTLTTQQPAGDD